MLRIYGLTGRDRLGEIDAWTSIEVVERDNQIGGCVLDVDLPNATVDELLVAVDPGLEIEIATGSTRSVYVPLDTIETDETADGDVATLAGPDALGILADRLSFTAPAADPSTWAPDLTATVSAAPIVMIGRPIVDNVAQSSPIVARRGPVTVTGALSGVTPITWRPEMGTVWEDVARLLARAADYTLRYQLTGTGPGRLIEFTATPRPENPAVVSIEAGTVDRVRVIRRAPAVTHAYGRYGSARQWRTVAAPPAGRWTGRRVERVRDMGNDASTTEIDQTLAAMLAEAAQQTEIVEAVPIIAVEGRPGASYRTGDLVRVDARGVSATMTVAAITTTHDADGARQTMELGGLVPDGLGLLEAHLADLTRRLAARERR